MKLITILNEQLDKKIKVKTWDKFLDLISKNLGIKVDKGSSLPIHLHPDYQYVEGGSSFKIYRKKDEKVLAFFYNTDSDKNFVLSNVSKLTDINEIKDFIKTLISSSSVFEFREMFVNQSGKEYHFRILGPNMDYDDDPEYHDPYSSDRFWREWREINKKIAQRFPQDYIDNIYQGKSNWLIFIKK